MATDTRKTLSLSRALSPEQQQQLSQALQTLKAGESTTSASATQTASKPSQQTPSRSSLQKTLKDKTADKAARQEIIRQRWARIDQALAWLSQTFTTCFQLASPHPLKIGIYDDILLILKADQRNDKPTHASLQRALQVYTNKSLYHHALLKATHRQDLEGRLVGEITAQEKTHAQAQLDRKAAQKHKKGEKKKVKLTFEISKEQASL